MQYTWRYASPLGGILLSADDMGLTGLGLKARLFPDQQAGTRDKCSWPNAVHRAAKLLIFSQFHPPFH